MVVTSRAALAVLVGAVALAWRPEVATVLLWSLAVAGGQAYFGSHYGLWKAGKSGEDPVHLKEMDRADSLFLSKDGHLYGATMDGGPKFHGYVFSFRLTK